MAMSLYKLSVSRSVLMRQNSMVVHVTSNRARRQYSDDFDEVFV